MLRRYTLAASASVAACSAARHCSVFAKAMSHQGNKKADNSGSSSSTKSSNDGSSTGQWETRDYSKAASSSSSSFAPYSFERTSTRRFHWLEAAQRMLADLEANGMKPTDAVGDWSFHNPSEALQKQHAIEMKHMRDIVNDPEHYTFSESATADLERFVASSGECDHVLDVLRWRIQHGVALPSEIAFALYFGVINGVSDISMSNSSTPESAEDKSRNREAFETVRRLAPNFTAPPSSLFNTGYLKSFTSALSHASGIGFNVGRNPSEWCKVEDWEALGVDAEFDLTTEKLLDRPPGSARTDACTSSFVFQDRIGAVTDWSKARVIFIDLPCLDKSGSVMGDAFIQYDISDRSVTEFQRQALFAPCSGFSVIAPDGLRRWRYIACCPKNTVFGIGYVSSSLSVGALAELNAQAERDPNLLIVLLGQAVPGGTADSFARWRPSSRYFMYDWHFVTQVSLKGLPLAGFSKGPGPVGASSWLDAVFTQFAPPHVKEVRCSYPRHRLSAASGWERELPLKQQNELGVFATYGLVPKMAFTPASRETLLASIKSSHHASPLDMCPLTEVWACSHREFFEGVPTPVKRRDFDAESNWKNGTWMVNNNDGMLY